MSNALPKATDAGATLSRMAGEVASMLAIGEAWPLEQRAVLERLKEAIEALHREALVRIVKGLRHDPSAAEQLKQVVRDPLVFGVLRLHGIVRDPIELRVAQALEDVAPMLAEHGGGVELVGIKPPDTVEVRLTGSCQSCPSSGLTLSEGVERAIKERAPEIQHVVQVQRHASHANGESPIHFISPFAKASDKGFVDVCAMDELVSGEVKTHQVKGRSLLLFRQGDTVSCLDNACAHLGMPLNDGEVADGVLACPHHGFRYILETGECLDVPEVQLVVHAVHVRDGRVAVKLES
jgi:Fe-S cluster biogenesis protein NfuA/nitrite reductase/ring-hydroxylating ferredoxin subunit